MAVGAAVGAGVGTGVGAAEGAGCVNRKRGNKGSRNHVNQEFKCESHSP